MLFDFSEEQGEKGYPPCYLLNPIFDQDLKLLSYKYN
jgi:hypothetical protein